MNNPLVDGRKPHLAASYQAAAGGRKPSHSR
jgi:hypothetical protein